MRLLSVFGTRPEAVKMAPLLLRLQAEPNAESLVCVTGQHRELLDRALAFFGVAPDFDLDLMKPGQSLNSLAALILQQMDDILKRAAPDRVIVQGDTTSAMAAALAAFHRGIPVAHVEAGLRARRMDEPWPEEMNRRTMDLMSDLLFAPTRQSRQNLIDERALGRIFVTGNTGVDALHLALKRLEDDKDLRRRTDKALPNLEAGRKIVLVTGHRRECVGPAFRSVCAALLELSDKAEIEIVFPVHPNPELGRIVEEMLPPRPNLHLIAPLDFPAFVRMMQRADVILTDSGGIQEEAPSLGKPVLVTRNVTERPEAVAAGASKLVGTCKERIVREVMKLLDTRAGATDPAPNPFGDGRAADRITDALLNRPVEEFEAASMTAAGSALRLAG